MADYVSFSVGSVVLDAFRAPIEITVGILYGIVCGLLLWLLPTKLHVSRHIYLFIAIIILFYSVDEVFQG